MIYGYIRVSSDKQTVENQRFEINNFCERESIHIDGWIEETISGTKAYDKRQLGRLLNKVQKDDLIICAELSRLGRNLFMIMEILNICMTRECRVWTIKDNYRLGDDIQSKVLAFAFGLSAEIERNLISQRTKEALARKKAEGVTLGRPVGRKSDESKYKLYPKRNLIAELLKEGISRRKIAKICKVDRNTSALSILFCWKNRSDYIETHSQDSSFGSDAWAILSDIEQRIKAKVESVGVPLKEWDIKIFRGVLTGCNDAFIITSEKRDEILANCIDDAERERTAELIRPILRGRDISKYGYNWAELWLINTHNGVKGRLERIHIEDYPSIKQHLDFYINKIKFRTDKGDTPYNLRNCAYVDEFSKPKIVWGNLNTSGNFAIAPAGMFINAPACMLVPGNNYLLAVLNSKVADYYLKTLGVVRNGGFFEYKPMFIEQIPVPKITEEQESQIDAILSSSSSAIDKDEEINKIIEAIYGFSEEEITFLHNQ